MKVRWAEDVARRLRIQFEGALYHVINRGNYRRDVFATVGAAQAFETVIAGACELHAWRLHAYGLLPNHYHLALETPQPNLVAGMHWLQSTFATRFNRFRQERGHLFQGRYQALLVEDAAALVRVVNYIHLNPVRARIVPAAQCASFRWSSLRRLVHGQWPAWLRGDSLLNQLGLQNSVEGWAHYVDYLIDLAASPTDQKRQFGDVSSGWAIGNFGFELGIMLTSFLGHVDRSVSMLDLTIPAVQFSGSTSELFFRLNQQVSLTAAEQRNAFFGPVRDQIRGFAKRLDMPPLGEATLGFGNSRMSYDDAIARVALTLEQKTLRKKITAALLSARYRSKFSFPEKVMASVETALNLLSDLITASRMASKP